MFRISSTRTLLAIVFFACSKAASSRWVCLSKTSRTLLAPTASTYASFTQLRLPALVIRQRGNGARLIISIKAIGSTSAVMRLFSKRDMAVRSSSPRIEASSNHKTTCRPATRPSASITLPSGRITEIENGAPVLKSRVMCTRSVSVSSASLIVFRSANPFRIRFAVSFDFPACAKRIIEAKAAGDP